MHCLSDILHSLFSVPPHVYKCSKPVLPEASTHVFVWDDKRLKMTYTGLIVQYENWDNDEIGYTAPTTGDSGAPYMIHEPDHSGEDRYTFVAVVSHTKTKYNNAPHAVGTYMRGESQCRTMASKLTPEILDWIKQVDRIVN